MLFTFGLENDRDIQEIDRHKQTLERLKTASGTYKKDNKDIGKLQALHKRLLSEAIERFLNK